MKKTTFYWKGMALVCLCFIACIMCFGRDVLAANPNNCNHTWSKATCLKAPVCTKCGMAQPNGSKAAHSWNPATCTTPKTCAVCHQTSGSKLGHDWAAATCTSPKTCKRYGCYATEGSKLGHSMTGATCTSAAHCTRCSYTEGSKLGHSMAAADCNNPAHCTRSGCSYTEGSALGHSWNPATCTSARQCARCKIYDGNALGHDWSAATCTSPKTCKRYGCYATEGNPLGHVMVAADCTTASHCARCSYKEGSPLGHSMGKATCTSPAKCTRMGCTYTEGSKLGHNMAAADCNNPAHCTRNGCSYTEGEPLGHSWNPATCTSARQCARCKIYDGEKLGHDWAEATCFAPKTCKRYGCNATEGEPLGHVMVAADCTTAAHCVRCSYKEGSPLGHSLGKATCTSPARCTRMGCTYTEGTKLGHDMAAADCNNPAHCTRSGCSYTEGEPLGHSWNAATCTSARQCARCKIYDGEKLGHDWAEATCFAPKTCKRYGCHATEGEPAGHTFTAATTTTPKTCSKCGYQEGNTVAIRVTFIRSDNGAPSGVVLGYKDVYYGKAYGQLVDIEVTEGYQKACWSFSPNGDRPVTADTVVTYTTDHVIYACTTYAQYTVSFDVNGGDGAQYVNGIKKTVTYGRPYGELPDAPTGKNLEFLYWAKADGTPVTESTIVTTAGNHTLYAQWHDTSKEVMVSFDANGGYGQQYLDNEKKKVTYGEVYGTLPSKPSAPEGMVFTGWYTDKIGGAVVNENTIVGTITDHTLYAHWKSNKPLDERYTYVTADMGGINYYPYYDTEYAQLFTDDTFDYDANGNRIYGAENLYGSNPGIIDDETAIDIYNRLAAQATAFGVTVAGKNLGNFIPGKAKREKLYFYGKSQGVDCIVNDASEILGFSDNLDNVLKSDTARIFSAAFDTVNEGDSIVVAPSPACKQGGVNFQQTLLADPLLWAGINSADTSELISVSFDGKNYNVRYKWYLYDYYDWDKGINSKIGIVSAQELYYLHQSGSGLGKNYINLYKRDVEFSFAASGNREDDLQRAMEIALGETMDYSDIKYYRYYWADGSVEDILGTGNGLPTTTMPTYEFDFPVITPLPTGTPRPTVPPTQAPTSTPVVTKAPTSTPVVTKAPTSTPVVTQAPTSIPVVTQTPVITQTPVSTPVVPQTPVSTPVITQTPVNTPAITQDPVSTPIVTQTPTSTPVATQAPVIKSVSSVDGKTVYELPSSKENIEAVLNEEEQVAVENGANFTIEAEVENAKTSKSDKKNVSSAETEMKEMLVESGAVTKKQAGKTDYSVGQTYNINVTKQVGDGQKKTVNELEGATEGAAVTVSVPISDDLILYSTKESRVYYMVSKDAEGNVNVNEAELDKNRKTLSFESTGSGKATLVYTDVPYFEKEGTVLTTSNALNAVYVVTKAGNNAGKVGEVSYVGAQTDKKNETIKSTVKLNGITYKVTGIADSQYENNEKLKKVTIGKNVESIGANAFAGCKNLKTIVINSTKLTAATVDATAFEGISSNAVVKVPAGTVSKYRKMFKKLGINVKVKSK